MSRAAREVFGACECIGVPIADAGEKIPYTVSDRYTRYLPKIELPQA